MSRVSVRTIRRGRGVRRCVAVVRDVPDRATAHTDGFVDTLATRGLALDHPLLVRFYNPIAAISSHHVAFAIITGMGIARHARGPLGRAAWRSYPAVVAVVVIATANHFVLDVIGGAVLGAVARKVAR